MRIKFSEVGALLVIFLCVTFGLGLVDNVTKAKIVANNEIKTTGIDSVFKDADSAKVLDISLGDSIVKEIREVKSGDSVLGHAVFAEPQGMNGKILILVGIDKDGKTSGVKVLSQKETKGLGDKILEESYINQYVGKPIDPLFKLVSEKAQEQNDVEVITGATISCDALTEGVNEALKAYRKHIKGEENIKEPEKEKPKEKDVDFTLVLPNSDETKESDIEINEDGILEVVVGYKAGKKVGYGIKASAMGMEGDIIVMIGVTLEGKIQGVQVLHQKETKGLGDKIEDQEFLAQFIGKIKEVILSKEEAKEDEVQSITSATISSQAVVDAANKAIKFFENNIKGKGGN